MVIINKKDIHKMTRSQELLFPLSDSWYTERHQSENKLAKRQSQTYKYKGNKLFSFWSGQLLDTVESILRPHLETVDNKET